MTVHSADTGFDTSCIFNPEKCVRKTGRWGEERWGWNSFTRD